MLKVKILPSLLAADFGKLREEAIRAEKAGADGLHIDIMDGHFVPNLSMGPDVVAMASKAVKIPLNVHLMLTYPQKYVERFIECGASSILIHIESECNHLEVIEQIKTHGVKAGITLNPDTDPGTIDHLIEHVDEVLCMSVYPGYGGQEFIPTTLDKIEAIRMKAIISGIGNLDLMVDGGINLETAKKCAEKGANCFIAGTFLYHSINMDKLIKQMKDLLEQYISRFNK